jgi:hypothetical protein
MLCFFEKFVFVEQGVKTPNEFCLSVEGMKVEFLTLQ